MASNYSYEDLSDANSPLPHPYLQEAKLYISGLAPGVRKEDLAGLFASCVPYRPNLPTDDRPAFVEFKDLRTAEKALATLQSRPLLPPAPSCNVVLSPFPPTSPPTSLPPPSALPRLVKQLPIGTTDSDLYDLFRPFGPLANVRSEAGFGPDIGVVEFWREDDAQRAEQAMRDPDAQSFVSSTALKSEAKTCGYILYVLFVGLPLTLVFSPFLEMLLSPSLPCSSIQVYQPRRAGGHSDFSASAPPFVPSGMMYQQQNVSQSSHFFPTHFLAIPPPVTPQPFSNILSLSSPMNSYSALPPPSHLSPPQSPHLGAQHLGQYTPPNSISQQLSQEQPYGTTPQHQSTSPPPYHTTPPMTPQRHLQHLQSQSSFSPLYPSPLSSPSQGGQSPRSSLHGSPNTYAPFSLPYTPPHAPLFYSPPGSSSPFSRSPPQGNSPFVHGPGQQVQYAPPYGPGSQSHSGLIDPCNLFIKNLDLNIDSNDLFTTFRPYGTIVSARVMRNENGQSRGFGFVSFQTPDQASQAMNLMNGTLLGSKPIIVRLHEPKQLRQEKLANRYAGRSPHPRSASGATSPAQSDQGEVQSPSDRIRRSSGSYYHAALAGTLNIPIRFEDLSALSPVVRKEVLTGELTRRLKAMDSVVPTEVDGLADSLVNLSLAEVIEGIQNTEALSEQIRKLKAGNATEAPQQAPAPALTPVAPSSSGESTRLLDPSSLSSTPAPPASAPEHPSTPLSITASLSDPPRTSSPSGSLAVGSEKDKLLASVSRVDPTNAVPITNLLLSLTKKERAMCLFNPEYLKTKVAEAKDVLEADDDREATESVSTVPAAAVTPSKAGNGVSSSVTSPQTPDLSSNGPSAVASPEIPGTPNPPPPATVHTLASLARLPATEIIKLASSANATGLPLPKADPLVFKATDEFIDNLATQSEQQKKQVVGTKLFKVVKAFGVRNAKITIHLLDTEDLRALTHLMNSYPSVLKEKVLQATAATAAK
ncbi:hypothetical protein FRB99_008203 [Tulasnella sp. 403]|nr:hypothetical protein FRB99_008203 [Tulasnella sp. 403]